MSKLVVSFGKVTFDLMPTKKYLMTSVHDLVACRVPDDCGLPSNKKLKYRVPVTGELCTLAWFDKEFTHRMVRAIGAVGDELKYSANNTITVRQFLSSTAPGCCGAIFQSGVDGKIVGWHGLGTAGSQSIKPAFYPVTAAFEIERQALNSMKMPEYVSLSDTLYVAEQKAKLGDPLAAIKTESKNVQGPTTA
jgi:hypothetical protein